MLAGGTGRDSLGGRPLRVVLDGRGIGDHPTGIGWYTLHLARELSEIGLEPILVGPTEAQLQGVAMDALRPRCRLIPMGGGTLSPSGHLAMRRHLRSLGADVYHCPYLLFPGFWGNTPLVVTVHDLIPLLQPASVRGSVKGRFPGAFAWLHRRIVSLSGRIITVSRHTGEDLARLFPQAAGKIEVVHNGVVPMTPLDPSLVESHLRRLGVQGPYVLSVGRRDPYKRLDLLIRAFAQVRDRIPGKLVLASAPDPRFPEAERALREAKLADRVVCPGYVAGAGLQALYQGARFLAHPSSYEGFGLPLLEAMQCGAPVLACRVASIPEVVDGAALLVEPDHLEGLAEGLVRMWEDEELRSRLVALGTARARQFSWRRTAQATARVYQAVLGGEAPLVPAGARSTLADKTQE